MKRILFLLTALISCSFATAQMAKFQALYIFQFAKNTSWPLDNALSSELKSIVNNKKVGDRPLKVLDAPTAAGLPKSDIIYLGESKSSQISSLVSAQANNKVLIVSGTKGHCALGAGIAFVANGGKLQFEIHEGNIAKNGLKVTPKLVTLGHQVF